MAACTRAARRRGVEDLEAVLKDNQVKALVATSALCGMGLTSPILGFVVHLGARRRPPWPDYQQVGRAGRADGHRRTPRCSPGAKDRTLGVLRHRVHAHRGEGHRRSSPHLRYTAAAVRRGAGARVTSSAAAGSRRSGARSWTEPWNAWAGMAEHRQAVALRRSAVRPRGLRRGRPSSGPCWTTRSRTGARMQFLTRQLDDPSGNRAGGATCARGRGTPRRRSEVPPRRMPPCTAPASPRAARPVAHGNGSVSASV
ncbi:hypothetical protein QJS66_09800 [Kocuria rhizophila]|nr:hypothetical protein QJS66_09800 [Kocuria rhizophila]